MHKPSGAGRVLLSYHQSLSCQRPFTSREALTEIEKIQVLPGLTLLPVPLDVVDRWVALLREHPVTGRRIFGAHQIVSTMLGNGITKLYTFNRIDFEYFAGIEVFMPVAP